MKAVVCTRYGSPDVLQLKEVEKPVPKDNEILVKVCATSVTIGDVRMRSFNVPRLQWIPARIYLGIRKPKRAVLGMELAGKIEAIGKNVRQFKVGDAVFGSTFKSDFGGHAEYKCLPENGLLAIVPPNVSMEEAAAGPATGGVTAMANLRKAKVKSGQKVLIYGASGSVGTFAVQLCKQLGAHVTAVCSTGNIDLVKSLGADRVIDYTREDFTASGPVYDVVFDAVGKLAASHGKKALKSTGVYLNVNNTPNDLRLDDLLYLQSLLKEGRLKSVIDRRYPLEAVAEAHRYVESGRKRGNVVITVN
jgi:NADPH:quinone reductase-like Zn-dependent oxidoreductase